MLKTDAEIDWEDRTNEQMEALDKLKKNLENPPLLRLPKRGALYMADTYASQYEVGSVLLQEKKVGGEVAGQKENRWVTIEYWSYALIPAERNCSKTERECLSVVWALETFRSYVE